MTKNSKHISFKFIALAFGAGTLLSFVSHADASSIKDEIFQTAREGKPYLDMRYRYEFADEKSKQKNANASTLRTKLGYKSGSFYNTKGVIEVENVTVLSMDDYYNSGVNNKTQYPLVQDPDVTELNQAYLDFSQVKDTSVKVGRQIINLDNERFVGAQSWRQNDQTYDSLSVTNNSLPNLTGFYGYIMNVNRPLGTDESNGQWASDIHLVNLKYDRFAYVTPTIYGYLMDIEDAPIASNKTFGASVKGEIESYYNINLNYYAEYAKQSEYGDNPTKYDADFYSLVGGIDALGFNFKAGYDFIGSDNGTAGGVFQFPLGTTHTYNGWSDFDQVMALNNGLTDMSFSVGHELDVPYEILDDTYIQAMYHKFKEAKGSAEIGDEVDILARKTFLDSYTVSLKLAEFQAEDGTGYDDIRKAWLIMGAKF